VKRIICIAALTACRYGFGDVAMTDPDAGPDADTRITYRDAVLADQPLGYWRLADSDTIAHDETGHADGTYDPACQHNTAGALAGDADTATTFGDQCTLDLGDGFAFTGNAPFTIELWLATDMIGNTQFVAMKETRGVSTPTDGYAIVVNQTDLYAERIVATNARDVGVFTLPATGFIHVAFVYDGATLLLYSDGVASNPSADPRPLNTYVSPLAISGLPGYGERVHGSIDEVAVYDHALAADRIQLHHDIGTLGPR
jgi:hypothetical protein